MTNSCISRSLGSKKSEYRRLSGCRLGGWSWCVLVCFLVCWRCGAASCLGSEQTVSTVPQGDINLLYPNNSLEIICIAENNYTANDLAFSLGGKQLNEFTTRINNTAIRLFIKNPEIQFRIYYCTNTVTRKHCLNRVLVDTPPQEINDFKCISKNLDSLKCSWTLPKTYTEITNNLLFFVNSAPLEQCEIQKDDWTRSCLWNTSTTPLYRQQLVEYVFNLRSCNIFQCIEQNITLDHFSVVKPDKPDLKVVSVQQHGVVLKWTIPINIHHFLTCGIDHKIEYQIAKIDDTKVFRQVDASNLPSHNETYRFELAPLPYAHKEYEVRVYIKSKLASDEYWSDFSYKVFETLSEVPPRPPNMPAGAFMKSTYSTYRVIHAYWQQLEEYEESGANFTYNVIVTEGNKTHTYRPDKTKSLSYVKLNMSLDAIHIKVQSMNQLGPSENSSYLYIPPDNQLIQGPKSFSILAYENGTYELSWDAMNFNNIDNFTLFWCQQNWTNLCIGRMNYTSIEANRKHYIINLPGDTKYQFALSANYKAQTSGMVWATCDISRDGEVMYRFPVDLHNGTPNKTFVDLSWSMTCKLREGTIIGYNITYCAVINNTNECDVSVGSRYRYVPDPEITLVNITDLLPCRTYKFELALNTIYGPKKIENATREVTTLEDTPTSPTNISITALTYNSLIISWDPPLKKNGNIKNYYIYNGSGSEPCYNDVLISPTLTDKSRRSVKITNLHGFTNYTFNVQACNTYCSVLRDSDAIFVRTPIGPPGTLAMPHVDNIDPHVVSWKEPNITGGYINMYQIKRLKDTTEVEIFNTTSTFKDFTFCDGVHKMENYQVRAINYDEHPNHGSMAFSSNVSLPTRDEADVHVECAGEWSPAATVACRSTNTLTMTLLFMMLLAFGIGVSYGSMKIYKKYRKMEDIKPEFPIGIPEKDNTKYTFSGWNTAAKDDKTNSSDEALLLPNSKGASSVSDIRHKDENCIPSDVTDSTGLSDSSRGANDRGTSTCDEGSDSSLQSDVLDKNNDKSESSSPGDTSGSEADSSRENSPCFKEKQFKKNPVSGYVPHVVSPVAPIITPQNPFAQPITSSYVMAAPTPANAPATSPAASRPLVSSSGYVRAEDAQQKSLMNLPKVGTSPTKHFGSESLPTIPPLPPCNKPVPDSSYIQMRSLDPASPSPKPVAPSAVVKPAASSGYVSPGDAVLNKHLNILSGGQLSDEPVILDPAMSPDAYCRFSWSKDPANDNLKALLDNAALDPSKN